MKISVFTDAASRAMEHIGSSPGAYPLPTWVKDAVFYQIFPERFYNGDESNDPVGVEKWGRTPKRDNFFGGDLKGVIMKLPYLVELGVTAIWFNPIFDSPSNHKYDTRDYMKIDPHLGDAKIFKELITQCHENGIRVILDGVFNHTGDKFWAFKDVLEKGSKSKYAKWYNMHEPSVRKHPTPNYDCWWGFSSLPKLMTRNPEVRKYLFDVVTYWTREMGIDGWRLDVPNEVEHEFWIDFRRVVKSINPEAYLVGEIWHDGSPWLKGDQFDGVMNYLFRDTVVSFFAKREIDVDTFDARLHKLMRDYSPQITYNLLNLLGSHDTPRFLTLCQEHVERMFPAIIFQMTYPGAPMIYYGDEVGLTGGDDPDCRKTMIWDESRQNRELLGLYRKTIAIRKRYSALRTGRFVTLLRHNHDGIYAYLRQDGSDSLVVVLNLDTPGQRVQVPLTGTGIPPGSRMIDILNDREYVVKDNKVELEPLMKYRGGILIPA